MQLPQSQLFPVFPIQNVSNVSSLKVLVCFKEVKSSFAGNHAFLLLKCFGQPLVEHYTSILQRQKLPTPYLLFQMLQVFHLFPSFAFVISLEQSIILPDYIYYLYFILTMYICMFHCNINWCILHFLWYMHLLTFPKPKIKFYILKFVCCQGIQISNVDLNLTLQSFETL